MYQINKYKLDISIQLIGISRNTICLFPITSVPNYLFIYLLLLRYYLLSIYLK